MPVKDQIGLTIGALLFMGIVGAAVLVMMHAPA